jgi:hypothetical protein
MWMLLLTLPSQCLWHGFPTREAICLPLPTAAGRSTCTARWLLPLICSMHSPVAKHAPQCISGEVHLQGGPLKSEGHQLSKGSRSTTGGPISSLNACSRGLNAMAISPDGSRVATAGRDGVLRVHDLVTGALLTGFRVRFPLPSPTRHPACPSMGVACPISAGMSLWHSWRLVCRWRCNVIQFLVRSRRDSG